jgi:hypothetical protein
MKVLRKGRLRVRFDRRTNVLGMMEWFAKQDIPVLPIHGVVDGRCACDDTECGSPGEHPISSLVSRYRLPPRNAIPIGTDRLRAISKPGENRQRRPAVAHGPDAGRLNQSINKG